MVNKTKLKPKSIKSKSIKKTPKKYNDNFKLSLLTKAAIGGLGALGTLGAGFLIEKELYPYLKKNYGLYPIANMQKYKQFIDKDYEELHLLYEDLTFKFYMDKHLYRFRDNYNDDKKNGTIKTYNANPKNINKITRLYDYIENKDFNSGRLRPKRNSIDDSPN